MTYVGCARRHATISKYALQELPLEYNTWLLFRQLVDIILLKCVSAVFLAGNAANIFRSDFLAYCMFAFSCFRVPEGMSGTIHIMR